MTTRTVEVQTTTEEDVAVCDHCGSDGDLLEYTSAGGPDLHYHEGCVEEATLAEGPVGGGGSGGDGPAAAGLVSAVLTVTVVLLVGFLMLVAVRDAAAVTAAGTPMGTLFRVSGKLSPLLLLVLAMVLFVAVSARLPGWRF